MAWTTPVTHATGDVITASQWNAEVTGNMNTLGPTVAGIIPASGTTATSGSGFTYTHTNGTGLYVFTFSTVYSATPVIQITNADAANGAGFFYTGSQGTAGFTAYTLQKDGVTASDRAFHFIASPAH